MKWYLEVLKKYAVFNGRARRSEYWYFFLFNIIISIVLGIIDGAAGLIISGSNGVLVTIYSLALLIPSIAVGVRRMHDVGKSGWFLLIPIYNIILACTDGQKGENQYGSDPKNQ
ncbi:MAG: DUF805 domain-containing protein, partial [Bacteroidetes bacterium]|nr:DUF805 domain-containing protein [Bacteroidota bacterium]